eukprot:g7568.t1
MDTHRMGMVGGDKKLVVEIIRTTLVEKGSKYDEATIGTIRIYKAEGGEPIGPNDVVYTGRTLELPYNNNEKSKSSLPPTTNLEDVPYLSNEEIKHFDDVYEFDSSKDQSGYKTDGVYNLVRRGNSKTGLHNGEDATKEMYDAVDKYMDQGYNVKSRIVQTHGSPGNGKKYEGKKIKKDALDDLKDPVEIDDDGKIIGDIKYDVGVEMTGGECSLSQKFGKVVEDCWEAFLGSLVIVFEITITFTGCIDGDALIHSMKYGVVPARNVLPGDQILGYNDSQMDKKVWCTVTANTQNGYGQVVGQFTKDHLIIAKPDRAKEPFILPNGNGISGNIKPHNASLRNIFTDCSAPITADGQAFTPFSLAFCPKGLAWQDYGQVLTALSALGKGILSEFVYSPTTWHDNETHPLWPALHNLCGAVAKCASTESCEDFEKEMDGLLESNIDPKKKVIVNKVWRNSSEMSAEINRVTHNTENNININIGLGFIVLFGIMCVSLSGCYYAYKRGYWVKYLMDNKASSSVSKVQA